MLLSRIVCQTLKGATGNDSRYCLGGLHVAQKGSEVVTTATNGGILLRVSETMPPDQGFPMGDTTVAPDQPAAIVPLAILDSAFKVAPKRPNVPVLGCALVADGTVTATDLATRLITPLPADLKSFPDVDRVLPKPEEGTITLTLGGHVLVTLAAAVKAFHADGAGDAGGVVTLNIPPSVIVKGDVIGAIGLAMRAPGRSLDGALMPCRAQR